MVTTVAALPWRAPNDLRAAVEARCVAVEVDTSAARAWLQSDPAAPGLAARFSRCLFVLVGLQILLQTGAAASVVGWGAPAVIPLGLAGVCLLQPSMLRAFPLVRFGLLAVILLTTYGLAFDAPVLAGLGQGALAPAVVSLAMQHHAVRVARRHLLADRTLFERMFRAGSVILWDRATGEGIACRG